MNPYSQRDRTLAKMGFQTYASYLESGLWRKIRRGVLGKKRPCIVCGTRANQVHHREYTQANLSGTSQDGMVPICRECHTQIEFTEEGTKRTLAEANCKLDELTGAKKASKVAAKVKKFGKGKVCLKCGRKIRYKTKHGQCKACRRESFNGRKQSTPAPSKPKKQPRFEKSNRFCDKCGAPILRALAFKTCLACREALRDSSLRMESNLDRSGRDAVNQRKRPCSGEESSGIQSSALAHGRPPIPVHRANPDANQATARTGDLGLTLLRRQRSGVG